MKKLNQKLTLKKETLIALDKQQMNNVKGGFTSIGHVCSHNNDCPRLDEPTSHCVSNHNTHCGGCNP
jgi:natural product precursor